MKPSIGRIVHYTDPRDGEIQPAIVSAVHSDEEVSLNVVYYGKLLYFKSVMFTTEPAGTESARGRWAWPARI